MSSFTTFLWNLLATTLFLVVWDQLVIDKTISIKSWTFTVEPLVPRATPDLILKLVVSTPALPSTQRSCIAPPNRCRDPVVESIDINGTILSKPLASCELESRLLQSLAVTAHATPEISNPSIYFKMSYQAEQTRQYIKQAVVEKLSC